ncbi:hypothetical protein BC826DRAFT_1187974 [Russula brevipes]|nr:hypothetical protein BC826DRAFT_1187974 [Russula brevipes]
MAIRVVRIIKRITRDNAFDWTVTALKTVTDVCPVPPLTAAANAVLSILQIVSDVKTNRQGCIRLAQWVMDLLVFLQSRMEGKQDAPKSLLDDIHEFERTLLSIYEYMCRLSQMNRIRRGLEKAKIQEELMQHEQKLTCDWAEWDQLSLSIETSYVLGVLSAASSNTPARIPDQDQDVVTNTIGSPGASSSLGLSPFDSPVTRSEVVKRSCGHAGSPLPTNAVYTEEEEFLAIMSGDADEFGFRKYHQSDVIVGKANRKAIGWFSGTSEADVCGRKATIKRYDGGKSYIKGVGERYQNVEKSSVCLRLIVLFASVTKTPHGSHGNLPQIIGYSDRKTPTPFILLASVQNRDLDSVMRSVLTTGNLADCATMILRTYRDVASAMTHAQRQLSLSEVDVHHFIDSASYGVSNDNHVIVGLPPPCESWRVTYCRGLEQSLEQWVLRNLIELVDDETATLRVGPCQELVQFNRDRQLYRLFHSLLPREGEGLDLSPELEDRLDHADEHSPFNLCALRAFSMHQLQSVRTWPDKRFVRPISAGDYGYIPGGSMDLAKFVFLGNIQDGEYRKEITQVVGKAECKLFTSEHDPVICHRSSPPVATSSISDEGECWLIPLPLNRFASARVSYEMRLNPAKHGREFLAAHGASLASKHEIEAQNLILVTRSQREHYYHTDGWSHLSPAPYAIELDSTASDGPAFPVPVLPAEPLSEPPMVYLITSSRPDFEAYVTDVPLSASHQHSKSSSPLHVGDHEWEHCEVIDYVQLDSEVMVS